MWSIYKFHNLNGIQYNIREIFRAKLHVSLKECTETRHAVNSSFLPSLRCIILEWNNAPKSKNTKHSLPSQCDLSHEQGGPPHCITALNSQRALCVSLSSQRKAVLLENYFGLSHSTPLSGLVPKVPIINKSSPLAKANHIITTLL